MRKYVMSTMCFILLLFFAQDVRGQYAVAFSKNAQKNWLEAKKRLPVKLLSVTRYRYKNPNGAYEMSNIYGGNCVVIGRFVITAQHVIKKITEEEIAGYLKKNGYKFTHLEIIGEWYEVEYENSKFGGKGALRLVFEDAGHDIALLEFLTVPVLPPSLPVKIGDTAKLEDGSFLIMSGSPNHLGRHFREGYVSAKNPFYPQLAPPVSNFRKGSYFGMSMHIAKGDSGSHIFAITERGDLEWVGIIVSTASIEADLWIVLKADIMLNYLREKTGIDLRAIHQN